MVLFPRTGCHNDRQQHHDVCPSKPVAEARVDRGIVTHGNGSQKRSERRGICFPLGDHASPVIRDAQDALFRRARDAEPALHSTQNRHATMQPSIHLEIPCGHQHKRRAVVGILAAQTGKVHVLADHKAPPTGRFRPFKLLCSNRETGLKRRHHVFFFVGVNLPIGKVQPRLVPFRARRGMDHPHDNGRARFCSNRREQRINIGQIRIARHGNLFRNYNNRRTLRRKLLRLVRVLLQLAHRVRVFRGQDILRQIRRHQPDHYRGRI